MRKALGATKEDECRLGVHKVANVRSFSVGDRGTELMRSADA